MPYYTRNYENSHALIVAIDEYNYLDTLKTAVRGAFALEDLLRTDFGFTTKLLLNDQATRENIIGWFSSLKLSPNDRVLFYFAGHGLTRQLADRKIGYLALSHLNPGTFETYASSVKMDDLIDEADGLVAKHVLLILDACFGGYVFHRSRSYDVSLSSTDTEADVQKYVQNLIERPVRYAISAGGDELVDDNASPNGNYSVFTHFLLEGLRSGAKEIGGLIRAKNLSIYLERSVGGYSLVNHKPDYGYIGKGGDGDFVFRFPEFPSYGENQIDSVITLDPGNIVAEHGISILQKLQRSAKITILTKITTGQSGSHVYLVDVIGRSKQDSNGLHFCKIYRTPLGDETKIYEAVSRTPISEYIPKLVDNTLVINGWMASVYAIAHQTTLRESQPLSRLIYKNILGAIDGVSSLLQLLEKWNPLPLVRQYSPPQALMLLPFARYRNASGIELDIVERIGLTTEVINSETSAIQFSTEVLPNPLAFLLRSELWHDARSISWPSGHVHGDLHSNNIIYLIDSKQKTVSGYPAIIDFDTYQSNWPVLFDLAYLEMDLCMRMIPPDNNNNRELWLRISRYLCQDIELPAVPPLEAQYYPLHSILKLIRQTVYRICEQQKGDFEAAFWIARTSAGLGFARKRKVNTAERKLMLLLAAHSLKKTLEEMEIEHKDTRKPIWLEWLDDSN